MKRIKFSIFVLVLIFFPLVIYAQVNVLLKPPPPFMFKLENLWKVTLVNPTPVTYSVYLQGTATESTEGEIVSATTGTFLLPPGSKIVNARDLVPMKVHVNNSKYTDVIENINSVPTGDYEICVAVIDAETGIQLGIQCLQTQTQNLSQVELLAPENNTRFFSGSISEKNIEETGEVIVIPGSFITFNWLPPSPVPPGTTVSYSVRITEIYGNQSPYDAMLSNPAFYKNENIYSGIFTYPIEGRKFDNNRRYAWQVKAYLSNTLVSESEVWEFTYLENSQSKIDVKKAPLLGEKEKEQYDYFKRHLLLASIDNQQVLNIIYDEQKEDEAAPFVFSGSTRLSLDAGYVAVPFAEKPKNIFTAEINPSVALYGLPFTANFLLSTQNESNMQSINSAAFNFDFTKFRENLRSRLEEKINRMEDELKSNISIEQAEDYFYSDSLNVNLDSLRLIPGWREDLLKKYSEEQIENLKDPEKLEESLDRFGLVSGWEKIFMSINTLGIGTNYPTYTDYTLSGVPVTGLNVEINPGIFYAAFTAYKNQRGIENVTYQRNLYAGRLGVGKKEGTHLILTGLFAKDDQNSMTLAQDNLTLTPKSNYVFGTETRLAFFENKLLIEGEGSAAVLTRDTRDPDLEINGMPQWVKGLVDPKISTSFDYSYSGKISFNNPESATRVLIGMKIIGPGYTSLGVPNLRNDQLAYDAKIEQKLFNRHLSFSTFFKNSHDNLIEWKRSTTTTTAFGVSLGLNFPGLPFLNVSYSPYSQKNDDPLPLRKVENKTTMISAITGYTFFIEELSLSTNVSYARNDSKTLNGLSDFNTNSVSITEAVSFNEPISFALTWGSINTTSLLFNSKVSNIDLSVNATVTDYLTNSVGFSIASDKSVNKKTCFYLDATISPIDNLSFQARLEGATYQNMVDNHYNYNELLFRGILSFNW